MKRTTLILLSLLFIFFAGCSIDREQLPDPGTAPPAVIPAADQELNITGSTFMDVTDSSLVHINLTSILNPDTNTAYENFVASNFVVIEDNVVQGFSFSTVTDSELKPKADIVFIIDTTISMGEEISGVKASIINFLDYLANQNLNLQVAGYAYADATVEYKPLASDYSNTSVFYTWIDGLSAGYMGFNGGDWPENGLDPIAEAMDDLSWRRGAQRIFILLTDDSFHMDDDVSSWTVDTLYNTKLKNKAIVHSIGKDKTATANLGGPYEQLDNEQYLSEVTGGRWVEMPADGNVDLTATPIANIIAAGYVLTYETAYTSGTHDVRVVVTADDGKDGEFNEAFEYVYQ